MATAPSPSGAPEQRSVPASAASQGAQYIVQGFRGTRVGDASDAVTVQFGTDGNGFATAALKMAA